MLRGELVSLGLRSMDTLDCEREIGGQRCVRNKRSVHPTRDQIWALEGLREDR